MKVIRALGTTSLLLIVGCKSEPQSIPSANSIQRNQNSASNSTTTHLTAVNDPTVGWGKDDIVGQKLKRAWLRFTADGHFRMAQPDDFKFSELAKQEMGEKAWRQITTEPYVYWWGAFAVIVVDAKRQDENRFGIILFLDPRDLYDKPTDKGEPYKQAWLCRNRDLSRTSLSMASEYWFMTEHLDDGTRKTCEVDWSARQKRYICN
jgi:hypothetical protein